MYNNKVKERKIKEFFLACQADGVSIFFTIQMPGEAVLDSHQKILDRDKMVCK